MASLYNILAPIYEAMYNTFIDYEDEYLFYSQILEKYNCTNLIEVGCGTGKLAKLFLNNSYAYQGIDLSAEMLSIARKNNPTANFIQADMRLFKSDKKAAGALMTGRTISYLLSNDDVANAFKSIKLNLIENGILVFDCIDASKFIPRIKNGLSITHRASHDNKDYLRESEWKVNFTNSWTFDWQSTYFEEKEGQALKIGSDFSTIRAFTKDEITILLNLCGFEILNLEARPSYAFETFVVTTKSIKQ